MGLFLSERPGNLQKLFAEYPVSHFFSYFMRSDDKRYPDFNRLDLLRALICPEKFGIVMDDVSRRWLICTAFQNPNITGFFDRTAKVYGVFDVVQLLLTRSTEDALLLVVALDYIDLYDYEKLILFNHLKLIEPQAVDWLSRANPAQFTQGDRPAPKAEGFSRIFRHLFRPKGAS